MLQELIDYLEEIKTIHGNIPVKIHSDVHGWFEMNLNDYYNSLLRIEKHDGENWLVSQQM